MSARRSGGIGVLIAAAALLLATVSVDRGRTVRIVDMSGAPVRTVLLVYHHESSRPNPVHPVTYEASGRSLIQSGSDGRVRIPPSVHVHWPFPLETAPRLIVDLVYAPPLHNGFATIYDRGTSRPGVFVVDNDLTTVRLADCSADPDLWEGTLMNVRSMIDRLLYERSFRRPRRAPRPETAALTRQLIEHFAAEYAGFLERYDDVPRPTPEMPVVVRDGTEADRRAWEEMTARSLAREPRWGDHARRLFAHDVERFASTH